MVKLGVSFVGQQPWQRVTTQHRAPDHLTGLTPVQSLSSSGRERQHPPMYAAVEELTYLMPAPTPTSRLEAFSDGVIAVIITIMVLELKVPRANGLAGLRAILPTLLVYLLSFTFTAIYWINHHQLVGRVEEVDPRILYSNLVFLFSLSLLPFFTSWVLEKEMDAFSVVLYAISLAATGAGFLLLRLAIMRRLRLKDQLLPADLSGQRKHWISLGLYAASIPAAFFHPLLALGCDALVTVIWILPDLGTRNSDHGHAEGQRIV